MIIGQRSSVSIIIPAYNYEQYVAECIRSCLGQEGFTPFEIIVVDDGSTDRTADIAQSFEPDIRLIVTANQGVESASNTGLAFAAGDYVVRVDADDRLKPNYLAVMVPEFERHEVAFLYSNYTQIDAQGAPVKEVGLPDFDVAEIKGRGDFLATGTLYRRETIASAGGYTQKTKNCGLENYEMILNLLASGFTGQRVHRSLFDYRIHGSNMSLVRRQAIIRYGMGLAMEFHLPDYCTNENHPYGLTL